MNSAMVVAAMVVTWSIIVLVGGMILSDSGMVPPRVRRVVGRAMYVSMAALFAGVAVYLTLFLVQIMVGVNS